MGKTNPLQIPCVVSSGTRARATELARLLRDALAKEGFDLEHNPVGLRAGIRLVKGSWNEKIQIREVHKGERPSGVLVFRVGDYWHKEHRDHTKRRLEERIPELVRAVQAMHLDHLEFNRRAGESRAREQAEREAHLAEEKRLKDEEDRFQGLLDEVERWTLSGQIRAYADAIQQVVVTEYGTGLHEGAKNWLAWARKEADRIDPIADLHRRIDARRAEQAAQGLELVASKDADTMARFTLGGSTSS